jgi:putative DNA primase/helicase
LDADLQSYSVNESYASIEAAFGSGNALPDKPLPGFDTKMPTAQVLAVNVERLAQFTGGIIDFRKFNQRAGGFVSGPPPRDLMMHLMARGVRSRLPRISMITASPIIRPDGTVLSEAGYDPATEVYLAGGLDLPRIPDRPTREDGLEALKFVGTLFSECAFADKDDDYPFSSVSLSAVLSVAVAGMARLLMSGIPMLTCNAATPGSGKSYVGRIIGLLLTGREIPVSNVAAGFTAELDKRLTAGLLGGAPIVHLDNCNGRLDSDLLCQILTESSVAVRPLATSEEVIVSGMPMVLANGNGVRVDENLARRTLFVELDAGMEKPELRNFNLRPDRLLIENRGAYVAAILTVLRAYLLATQRGEAKPIQPKIGSFEGWSDVSRSLMVWYGYRDPAEAMAAAQSEDPEKAARGAVFTGLRQLFNDSSFTVGEVIARLENARYDVLDELEVEGTASQAKVCRGVEENLKSLLPKLQNRPMTAQLVGILFRGWVTKVELGLRFRRLDRNAANVTTYAITPVHES